MSKAVLQAFLSMKPRENDVDAAHIMATPEMRAQLIVQIEQYPAVALPNAQNPVMIAGAVLSDDIAELWMVAGEGFDRHILTLLKQCRQLIATAREALAPRTLTLAVNPDRAGTERFARALGFAYEKRNAIHVYTLNSKGKN